MLSESLLAIRLKDQKTMFNKNVNPGRSSPQDTDAQGRSSEPILKVYRSNDDEDSLRMGDEGCPNEAPGGDDATGYSKEEEEANSIGCEEAL